MNSLRSQTHEITVSPEDSRLRRTIAWLLDTQSNGSWGNGNVATTSLVVIALHDFVYRATGDSSVDDRIFSALTAASGFLSEAYSTHHFEEAVWDTAIAGRALHRCPDPPASVQTEIEQWLLAIRPELLNAGPHHLAQRALLLSERSFHRDLLEPAAQAVASRVEQSHFVWSPYVLGQCIEAVVAADLRVPLEPYVNPLVGFLGQTKLDSANFVNICVALHALNTVRVADHANAVRTSVASLFGKTCFRDDGTWYHDSLCTAWAIIALTAHSREVIIRAPRTELLYEVESAFAVVAEDVERLTRRRDFAWMCYVIVAFVLGAGAAGFGVYAAVSDQLVEWISWAIGGVIGAGIALTTRFMIRARTRRDASSGS